MKPALTRKLLQAVLAGIGLTGQVTAQHKPVLDKSVYDNWPEIGGVIMSNNGKYMMYSVSSGEYFGKGMVIHQIQLHSTDASWSISAPGVSSFNASFTEDSKSVVFINPGDSLCIIALGTSQATYMPGIGAFRLSGGNHGNWLAYQPKEQPDLLTVRNMRTGREQRFDRVNTYTFSKDGSLIIQQKQTADDAVLSFQRIDLESGRTRNIWSGKNAEGLVMDHTGRQLAFLSTDTVNGKKVVNIWYYKDHMEQAVLLADDQAASMNDDLTVGRIDGFSQDGNRLLLELTKTMPPISAHSGAVQLNVWSYTDSRLPSHQIKQPDEAPSYRAVFSIATRRMIRLMEEHESSWQNGGDYLLVMKRYGNASPGESWNRLNTVAYHLVSVTDGRKIELPALKGIPEWTISVSPEGKYVIYFDTRTKHFFSIEIATGALRNLTKDIRTTWWGDYGDDFPGTREGVRGGTGIAGWTPGDKKLMVYDRHDIWLLDPLGRTAPQNLTSGYGRRHDVVFYMMKDLFAPIREKVYTEKTPVILNAFNLKNKENGFFRMRLDKPGEPELLTMGPYVYYIASNGYLPDRAGYPPQKAKDADVYIVQRESTTESPNYFSTKDFKTFTKLSDLHPERQYNWYTKELHSWRSLNGDTLQGILFKPENFDPNKKYPVILHYYERKSDGLNAYIKPACLGGGCNINIPSYVSNGYLVFQPDIRYPLGNPMQGTYDAVVSAAQYLSQLSFVDGKKLGLQGCSYGGIQTNYLVTHTTGLFAAACTSSGESDYLSHYGSLDGGSGESQQSMYEHGQNRMGATPWEIPDRYINNSAIYGVHKVTTPILIMHGAKDTRCLFYDATAFFTALRRMGKKAWMLEYTNQGHGLRAEAAEDFSDRMMQFFDHYLKDKPAPKWMTRGVPVANKGIDDGMSLDDEIKTPPEGGLLTPEERAKVDALMRRKPLTITIN